MYKKKKNTIIFMKRLANWKLYHKKQEFFKCSKLFFDKILPIKIVVMIFVEKKYIYIFKIFRQKKPDVINVS